MGWFSSSAATPAQGFKESSPAPPNNLAADVKSPEAKINEKPKPCCVCKDEKVARDDCMLFSTGDDPQEDCKGMVQKYRECMKGYGFNVA